MVYCRSLLGYGPLYVLRYKICKLYPSLMVRQILFGLSSLRHERQADSETVNEDSEDLVQDEHADAGFEEKGRWCTQLSLCSIDIWSTHDVLQ